MNELLSALKRLIDPKRAETSAWFFKTGKGQYGYGDQFWGIRVPDVRNVARIFAKTLPLSDIEKLFLHPIHEVRLCAVEMLVLKMQKVDESQKKELFDFYLSNTQYMNNWDLVDASAEEMVGEYLMDKDRSILEKLAKSSMIWERRIAMIATFAFIKKGESKDALQIAEKLLDDEHDLIRKAVGWMLREVGKRVSREVLESFLQKHYQRLSRTTLRYAIEHFEESKRKKYLKRDF